MVHLLGSWNFVNFESLLDNFCNCSTASLGVLGEKIQIQIGQWWHMFCGIR